MLNRWGRSSRDSGTGLTRLRATMYLDTLQRGQFQAKLWRALVLLCEIILRKDSRTFGQFLEFKKLGELLNLAHFVLSEVKNSGGIRASSRKHQSTPVLDHLGIDLAQIRSCLREFVDQVQYGRAIEFSDTSKKFRDSL